ncbi:MAG: zf-HC2 domain-containing protein [Longimicrobiales bacterium]
MSDEMNDQTNAPDCGAVRELIPSFVGNTLSAGERDVVESHVRVCAECDSELALAHILFASRPRVPAGLLGRIERAAATDRRAPARTWWGVSAAAIAALALGIGITSDRTPQATLEVPGYAYEAEEGEIWVSDDGLVAGAPALDDLSDEALLQFLDELTTGAGGGGA